jgi:superfamily II DNA or RNA helicase/diadenosine tetraphosphate (Ap4A) HIT family hydrolase
VVTGFDVDPSTWVAENEHAIAFRDRHPVSPGHTLVVTRRAVATWFDASEAERLAVVRLLDVVKAALDAELHPDGYNVGFNAGPAAGQTVMHLHVHVIPRFQGDMDDPRGGVRHVIPSRGNYLREVAPLATGGLDDPFARHVLPLFDQASEIAIVAAFVQESGLARIRPALAEALVRGVRVRILTGDYLEITQASALEMLLDWQQAASSDDDEAPTTTFQAKIVEAQALSGRAFHPKSWIFRSKKLGVAFVGSSNLSRSALDTGVEWNLRVDRDRDARAYDRIWEAFERAWSGARVLDSAWIQAYAARARAAAHPLPLGDTEAEPVETPPEPHAVQSEALAALAAARATGRQRALVVLATGLGKTWLAAFDYAALRAEGASGPRPRLLFLAHRRELLRQAAGTYRRLTRSLDPGARVGWFTDQDDDLQADLVFASVAKLARKEHLAKLVEQRFDYVVVDEVHHAAADSYRRILGVLAPRFLLGLTATPDRADDGDIMGLFDDFVAYRADIATGVALGNKTKGSVGLVPFHYFGVKDDIDYEHIPWRNRRFDADALAEAAQTEARMETLWRAWQAHPGQRSLVFCCSIAHAKYVRAWLTERGIRVRAVFSGEGSDARDEALAAFERGELDALCAVDVFNEGVDVPSIDRVVMLRPTESSVVFLQQLGRGLRASPSKDHVTVVDFVGNHRVFLERVRTLLSLAGGAAARSLRGFLQAEGEAQLPAGCSVDLELEAKALLARLFRVGGADEVERAYRELRVETGARPTAGQLQRMGYLPSRLRERHGSWLEFVRGEGDLADDEERAVDLASGFLREVETTEMTKCFKMVTLLALLDADALGAGLSVGNLALRSHALLRRSPELYEDVAEAECAESLEGGREQAWTAYWRKNPIAAWTAEKRDRRTWFRLAEGDRFVLDLGGGAALPDALPALARELVDYRLAQYRARKRQGTSPEGFVCKVTWNQRDPILKVPRQPGVDLLPRGETDVRLPNGSVWQFRFAKEFCNVARPAGTQHNQLPELLIRWFGPRAGQPGTAFEVRFHASPDGLWVEPVQATVHELAPRRGVVAYPDLRAAAGHALGAVEAPERDVVLLPIDLEGADLFAVRVAGTSMDGGREPLRDGDWAVMRAARSAPGSALADRVVLVQVPGEPFGSQYQIKRLRRRDHGWLLTSDNPAGPTIEPREDMAVVARLERVVHAEDLGPAVGTVIEEAELADRFGLETLEARSGRQAGHLFVFIAAKGVLEAPDRLRYVSSQRRPGETAFVLAKRAERTWRYCGVARQVHEDGSWGLPEVDYPTWRTWGEGRDVSRRLPDGALARAQLAVDALLALGDDQRWIAQADGRRARVLGAAARGGLRIDGSEGGFSERTVSLQDIGWVIAAGEDVERNGGVLDEERVNRLRYLESTPKGATRWIDTGWALAAWGAAKGSR